MGSRLFLLLRSSRRKVFCEKDLRHATLFKKSVFEISKNTFSYRTPLVAASGYSEQVILSRTFLLFQVGYTQQMISAIPCRLDLWSKTFVLCCSEQVILSGTFLLLKLVIQRMFLLSSNFLQFCVLTQPRPFFETSPRHLPDDVLKTSLKTSPKRLPDNVLKTSLKTS